MLKKIKKKSPSPSPIRKRKSNKTILFLDSDKDVIQELSRYLEYNNVEETGYEVVIAKNAREALDAMHSKTKFCFIVMEIVLPVVNGYSLLKLLLKKRVPVVVYTKLKGMEDFEQLSKLKIHNLFSKALMNVEDLMKVLRTLNGSKKVKISTLAMELQSQLNITSKEEDDANKIKITECPHCHNALPQNIKFCSHCGQKILKK